MLVGGATVGCGGDDGADAADAAAPDARPIDARPPDAPPVDAAPIDAPSAAAMLAAIDTFVVLMMENRSFDHYLGSLRLLEGRAACDGLTGSESNPAPDGTPVPIHRLDDFTPADPPHDWDPCHAQWNQGANDGFVRAHAGASQADVMGYHTRAQLPITYAVADAGATCDRWFASVMGPTWPNRFYLHGATSNGNQSNTPAWSASTASSISSTTPASATRTTTHDVAWAVGGYGKLSGNAPIEDFFDAAAAGHAAVGSR
jgi:phospholipase C